MTFKRRDKFLKILAFKDEKDLSKERKQLVPLFYSQILI